MQYDRSSTREKWTIMMYMRKFDLMTTYAYALRASNELTKDNIDDILAQMERDGIYRPRYGGSTFTGTFKTIQVAWYMFGYYDNSRRRDKTKKLVFSPLGNLLLDNIKDHDKVARIFLAMLFGNGFRQPFSQMDSRFNIYAFRLIFQLLRDPRLDGRLYHDEVFYLAMFIKQIDADIYEQLVRDIQDLRLRDPYAKLKEFRKNQRVIGLSCHEWRYAAGMLESAGIVRIKNDHDQRAIGKLVYGNNESAKRTYYEDYIELSDDLVVFADKMLESYPYFELPYPEDEISTSLSSETVVRLYSFYPQELLSEIGMDTQEDKAIAEMLSVAIGVKTYSNTQTKTGARFEYALEDAFNLFADVEAQRVGGSGNADVECLFTMNESGLQIKKFDVEAKSTTTKLLQIVPKRLQIHREKINSQYTIVVAPNFARGVLSDISGEDVVVVKAATLANYLYQYILKTGRCISYAALDGIVCQNTGKDITEVINEYVYSNFGHGYSSNLVMKA